MKKQRMDTRTNRGSRMMAILLAVFLCIVHEAAGQQLYINEIQVANVDRYIDPSFNYGAWIELYNPGTEDIQLNGHVLRHTDQEGNTTQASLNRLHGKVPAGGYTVLWFDHHTSSGYYGPGAGTQIPYKLDADGGVIELRLADGTLVDAVEYPACIARCAWMRQTDGSPTLGWTANPTPNATNSTSHIVTHRLQAPRVNTTGGTFAQQHSLQVEIPAGCTLYYTTDGSTPQPGQSSVSRDGTFGADTSTIYRFMLAREGYLHSPVVTRSWIRDQATHTLPILCVNTAPANLFDDIIGLYVKGTNGRINNNSKVKANQNMDWERPVNVEYFVHDENRQYREAANQEMNFSIFGGWTRFNEGNKDFEHRTSFKLKSDKVFEGVNQIAYPVFGSKPYIKIKNLLVRNGGQDRNARIWDGAIQELIRTSGVYIDCQAWQPAHVYLDGKYLGMMNLREESNRQFAFSNYGIDRDEIDQWEGDIIIKEGDKKMLDEWYALSRQLTAPNADTTIWNAISAMVDIDEYCNYMAAEVYMGNQDWLRGGFKNLKGFRAKDENGKFHIVMHDVDGGFGDTNMLQQIMEKGTGTMPIRFKNMLKYEPFRKQFIDAFCLMNGSVFAHDRCQPIVTAMKEMVNPALALEGFSADEKVELLISRIGDDEVRRPALKESLKEAFELTDEYTTAIHTNTPEATLLLNGQEIPTGRFAGYLFPPITLTSVAPAGNQFVEWRVNGEHASADSVLHLSEAFAPGNYEVVAIYRHIGPQMPPLRINEVSAGNDIYINEYGKKADWIELYNGTDLDYDLTGAYLTDNAREPHKYQITASDGISTIVPAHGYKVVWCDGQEGRTQLHASFKLKNADDAFVSITGANDEWTDSLRYMEQPRWHTYGRYPDGGQNLALMERPTIEDINHLCTGTQLETRDHTPNGISDMIAAETDRHVIAVRYYTLSGRQLTDISHERIVLQQRIYNDGTQVTRKVMVGNAAAR